MKVKIRLISKYTGKEIAILGSVFDTIDEAKQYFKDEVCNRCHRMEIVYLHKDTKKQ